MNEKDQQIFDEYTEEMKTFQRSIDDHNKVILQHLRKELGGKYVNDIRSCLEDSEAGGKLTIVDNPGINPQMEDWRSFDHIQVDQYLNGGMEGDSFAGYVYIPLTDNKYLKSHYSM